MNVDGAASSNPGSLAAGEVCRDSNGRWLFGFTRKLGWCCIAKAQIYAIFTGLQLAWDHGCRRLILESDSLLAVQKILHPLYDSDPLFNIILACQRLLK
ncbi:hypothetical protein REPUB_Repub02eG0217900 [Reevesia pubescens]